MSYLGDRRHNVDFFTRENQISGRLGVLETISFETQVSWPGSYVNTYRRIVSDYDEVKMITISTPKATKKFAFVILEFVGHHQRGCEIVAVLREKRRSLSSNFPSICQKARLIRAERTWSLTGSWSVAVYLIKCLFPSKARRRAADSQTLWWGFLGYGPIAAAELSSAHFSQAWFSGRTHVQLSSTIG